MSAYDTAKDIVRIGITAGLSNEVIGLLEKKATLLAEENATLAAKVSRLEVENIQLRTQVKNSQPVFGGLQENMGVLWKRAQTGFENIPYCRECKGHPLMTPIDF